ncbi:MAG: tetraacyldisaccharide 4'-kinase [Alphaproteobacteria bacterium]|nr:tetraacyldisaccharide 4'-kinase [Alphaproteobacteria bacterium]
MRTPDFWQRDGLVARALGPASWVYGAVAASRRGAAGTVTPPIPVVCVGNLVAGGAGKTPVALALGERLAGRGHAVHFLSRGYGGREKGPLRVDPERHGAADVGDEPLLLARIAPTWVSADRPAGAAAAADAGAPVAVMDDGHQNASIEKVYSIVVIDGAYGFGNGRLLPAGPLREPAAAGLARADAVIAMGPDEAGVARNLPDGITVLGAGIVPRPDSADIAGRRVVAFAGIARPEKFFRTLSALGCRIEAAKGFPDHRRFREAEISSLVDTANAAGAIPVTTAKDAVRLPSGFRDKVRVLHVALEWEDEDAAEALIGEIERRTRVASGS